MISIISKVFTFTAIFVLISASSLRQEDSVLDSYLKLDSGMLIRQLLICDEMDRQIIPRFGGVQDFAFGLIRVELVEEFKKCYEKNMIFNGKVKDQGVINYSDLVELAEVIIQLNVDERISAIREIDHNNFIYAALYECSSNRVEGLKSFFKESNLSKSQQKEILIRKLRNCLIENPAFR